MYFLVMSVIEYGPWFGGIEYMLSFLTCIILICVTLVSYYMNYFCFHGSKKKIYFKYRELENDDNDD